MTAARMAVTAATTTTVSAESDGSGSARAGPRRGSRGRAAPARWGACARPGTPSAAGATPRREAPGRAPPGDAQSRRRRPARAPPRPQAVAVERRRQVPAKSTSAEVLLGASSIERFPTRRRRPTGPWGVPCDVRTWCGEEGEEIARAVAAVRHGAPRARLHVERSHATPRGPHRHVERARRRSPRSRVTISAASGPSRAGPSASCFARVGGIRGGARAGRRAGRAPRPDAARPRKDTYAKKTAKKRRVSVSTLERCVSVTSMLPAARAAISPARDAESAVIDGCRAPRANQRVRGLPYLLHRIHAPEPHRGTTPSRRQAILRARAAHAPGHVSRGRCRSPHRWRTVTRASAEGERRHTPGRSPRRRGRRSSSDPLRRLPAAPAGRRPAVLDPP